MIELSHKERSKFINRLSQVAITCIYKVVARTCLNSCDKLVFETLAS